MKSPARTTQPLTNHNQHATKCFWFWAWAAVGAVGALGMVSLGPIALGPALVASATLSADRTARRSTFGMLAGAGLVSWFIAHFNAKGREPPVGTQQPARDATNT